MKVPSFALASLLVVTALSPLLSSAFCVLPRTATSGSSIYPLRACFGAQNKPQDSSRIILFSESEANDSSQQQKQEEGAEGAPRVEPDTHEELMYALGVNLARQLGDVRPLVESGEELAEVAKGLLDTVVGRLPEEGQTQLLARRGKELNNLIAARANNIREKLEQAGKEMLEQMKQNEDAVELPSGVVVHILDKGPEEDRDTAQRPTKSSSVKIHYHGTLGDGTVFDTTLGGEPVVFPLNGVIPGWREGVLKLREGETAMIGIPPEQGYGAEGTPDGRIPGGSTLFFKVQLLEVVSAGIGGSGLFGADGQQMKRKKEEGSGLLGVDGKPLK